jgi:EpsI family protein
LVAVAAGVYSLDERQEILPPRTELTAFPLALGDWQARQNYLPADIEEALNVDDYLLADYKNPAGPPVNFYIAFYASQRKGSSPHSPRVCLPGGGWRIADFSEINYPLAAQTAFPINRAILELNSRKQLVYYWFEQRGRRIANEYWMKWYLLVDSIMMNRTDGALVRIITPIYPSEDVAAADQRLQDFLAVALPPLPEYIPN